LKGYGRVKAGKLLGWTTKHQKSEVREEGARIEERYAVLLSLCRSVESRLPFDPGPSGDFELGRRLGSEEF
jgi:hypothetical protein